MTQPDSTDTSVRNYPAGGVAEQWDPSTGWYDAYDEQGNRVIHRRLTADENAVLNPTIQLPLGPPGPPGPPGPSGQPQWAGEGPPGVVIGASPGDSYIDTLTGDIYHLE